jgi:trehalose 6-phosphate synthase
MSGRLIVVSNRIPSEDLPSGGLVVALHEALSETGGLWIGAHSEVVETARDGLEDLAGNGYAKKAFRLTEEERRSYYLGYANSVLWPLCHRRSDLIEFERAYAEGYLAVNRRVARAVAALAGPDDLIWIHDYHFLPLAAMLRARGVTARIGLFLHIPFPVLADLDALPEREDFPGWIAAFDVVGLQTEADVARCREMFRAEAELLPDGRVRHGGRAFAVRAFPIGIDTDAFAEAAAVGGGEWLVNLGKREDLLIGVDRLDYSKGLPNRFRAMRAFLDGQQTGDRRASLLQIAPPSREEVGAYQDIRDELERLAGCINGRHAELDWTPIRYIHRGLPREQLAVLYRVARVGLVTPLADGMNLVAKEYVAAQDPEDPGVLVLSRMAGAAEAMTEALLVNPYDIEEMALAIDTALAMPLAERRRRHRALMEVVRDTDVALWRRRCIEALARVERPLPVG